VAQAINEAPKTNRCKLSDIDWSSHFEGIAIDLLCNLRPKKIGANSKSIIWNTAARIGQLDMVRECKLAEILEKCLQNTV